MSTLRVQLGVLLLVAGVSACSSPSGSRDGAVGDTNASFADASFADASIADGSARDAPGLDVGPLPDANHAASLGVDLGGSGDYVMLAMSGISTVPTSAVTGDLAVSPGAATLITGFSLTVDATGLFATSSQVTGHVYAADYGAPTPATLTTAIGDMQLAFTDAAGRAPDVTELGAGNIGGMTLQHGVYRWGTGLLIPTDLTLSGSATDVWIFEVAQDLELANGIRVNLTGGALARNVYWQVSGQVSIGTTAHLEGIVLSQTSITMGTGASVVGRLLAQTAVNIDGCSVVEPTP